MDRGFGSSLRGVGSTNRDRFTRDERRYDDFYSDSRRSGSSNSARNNSYASNSNQQNRGSWGSSVPRDRGFFNQNRNRGTMNGQMIAALQQQQHLLNAFMSNQGTNRNIGRGNQKFNQNRHFNNNRDNRGGNRVGEKRKNDVGSHGGKRNKKSEAPARQEKKEPDAVRLPKVEENVDDIPDEEVEISDSLMDSVERLRQRTDVERNVADEDVRKLVVFCFTGKGYQCLTCGLLFSKEESFINHLMSKSHVMNVIDARTAKKYQTIRDILDIDLSPDDWFEKNEKAKSILMKQAKLLMKTQREQERRERENFDKNPANFFSVSMATRKTARKVGDKVAITSLVESTIEVKEFDKDRFFGCEFVKAITGFHCRLCNMQIKEASGVLNHVSSRVHKNNYQVHLNRNKTYEKVQAEQNKELFDVLTEHDGSNVLLHETDNANSCMYLQSLDADLVRDKKLLEPPEKKTEEKKDGKKEENSETKEQSEANAEESKEGEEGGENATVEESEGDTTTTTEESDMKEDENEDHQEEEGAGDNEAADGAEEVEQAEETEDSGKAEEAGEEENMEPEEKEEVAEDDEANPEQEATELANDVEEVEVIEAPQKPAVKKNSTPRRGTAKRGRGRGARVTPSPRNRRSAGKGKSAEGESQESSEGAPVESFEIVDDIDEE